jgi:phosphatidylserine/phosphatidylglycerophosphate/cardiolipin synthase-like enzyme
LHPVVKEIGTTKDTALVQAYSFTSAPIAKALVDAYKRGVKVQVILDRSQRTEKYSSADFVSHAGIPTLIDDKHAIAHNKVMVLDGQTVITGSFNFAKAAEVSNAENLLVIRDKTIAEKYAANWRAHAEHSERYGGKEKGYSESARPPRQSDPIEPAPSLALERYVTSANSEVFHREGCGAALKISAKNLTRYMTREEAIQAGKRPCAECRP